MNINEYLVKFKNTFVDPRAVLATEVFTSLNDDEHCNKAIITSIVDNIYPLDASPCEIGADVFNDVEFFKCFTEKASFTVFDKINCCTLQGSSQVLKKFFERPTYDIDILKKRQCILQSIETKTPPCEDIYNQMKKSEKDVIWIYEELDQNLKELYEMVFFKFCLFKPLNNNPHALTVNNIYKIACSPVIGVLSPILYIIIPYLIVLIKLKIKIPFKMYIKIMLSTLLSGDLMGGGGSSYFRIISYVFSIVFYFQGILNSFEISKTLYKISRHLVEKVNNIVGFLKNAQQLNDMFWTDDIKNTFFQTDSMKDGSVIDSIKNISEEKEYIDSLSILPFSLYTNFGKQLHTYITLKKDIIKSILLKTYTIESIFSILNFKKELNISYVTYEDSTKPVLDLVESFHPCIDLQKVVKNDISLYSGNNAILTGPNAGGKSTFVKSLIINTLLGQTIGICIASKGSMTPFYIINSQINIPDCKGYESLFEAEMYRCKEKLDILKRCPEKHSLFIMDEIFNSTNPVEGIAGAYAIAKKISEYPNCILMFTTHYIYLTKLHKTGRFLNYKMNIGRTDGNIVYPYKLVRGVSKQYIALDLLAKNGFDEDIINEAIMIKDKLVKPSV
jgi:DNA mismatch repair ATPase MutS